MKSFIFLFSIVLTLQTIAQKQKRDILHTTSFEATRADTLVRSRYSITQVKSNLDNTISYYWFYDGQINVNQGNYVNKPLHGDYMMYNMDNMLIEKGYFKFGAKQGIWTRWRLSGKLLYIKKYRKGKLHGVTRLYNEDGVLIYKQKYRRGELIREIGMVHDEPLMNSSNR